MNTHRTQAQARVSKGMFVISLLMVLCALAFGIYAWMTIMPHFLDFLDQLQGIKTTN